MVDSIDSCIMLYSYSGFPERGWSLLQKKRLTADDIGESASLTITPNSDVLDSENNLPSHEIQSSSLDDIAASPDDISKVGAIQAGPSEPMNAPSVKQVAVDEEPGDVQQHLINKHHAMSNLSIILTLVSILVRDSLSNRIAYLTQHHNLGGV